MRRTVNFTAFLTAFVLLLGSPTANAEIVTIALEGAVTLVRDDGSLLDGAINIDDIITGTYTYNTDTPDSNPSSTVGDYCHYESPFGISLSVGGFDFRTDPCNVDFVIGIANNHVEYDSYVLGSYNNLPIDDGIGIDHISWQLDDSTGTAIDSVELPLTAPVLTDWESPFELDIDGGKMNNSALYIRAEVYSVELIPEPSTIILIALGGCFIRRFRR